MELSLGYSPCPNDCFIFDALVHKKIDCQGIDFHVELHDVETLNQMALRNTLDITKLSFHAYGYATRDYILLRSGSALGFNCGPLLVSARKITDVENEIRKVAIPGKLTTANFLLSLAFPGITDKDEYEFSEIEEAVLNGGADAGLIIHENRFTYEQKGLHKVLDLGEYWESLIHAPIPLGGIAMSRRFDNRLCNQVSDLVRKSVEFAFEFPESSMPYVRAHAQAMDEEVMKKHIALYVNEFSRDLGKVGTEAVRLMFARAGEQGIFKVNTGDLILGREPG
jgi:1,4-dihydroxy-6-naphthoate synthase